MLLQGKVVVVTGASQGIGKGIALGCARSGAKVVVHAFGDASTTADALALQAEIHALGGAAAVTYGDIADPKTSDKIVEEALRAFGRIDCLVSNAGICPFYAFLDIPHKVWDLTRSVNLDGAFFVVQAVAKQMERQVPQGGSIVAVSSISALVGGGEQCHYTPTKAGVKSLMESCAISLAPYGIRCNSVLPGTIETAINSDDLAQPEKRAYMNKRIPLGRLGKPEDLAGPVVFFLSDMASYEDYIYICSSCSGEIRSLHDQERREMHSSRPTPPGLIKMNSQATGTQSQSARDSSTSRANRKLPEAAKRDMRDWYEENWDNPYPAKHFKSRWSQEHALKQQQIENFFINLRRRDPRRKPAKVASRTRSPSPRDGSPSSVPCTSVKGDSFAHSRSPSASYGATPPARHAFLTSTRRDEPTSPAGQPRSLSLGQDRLRSPALPAYLFGPSEGEQEEGFGAASSASSQSSSFWSVAEGSNSYSPHSERSSYGTKNTTDYSDSIWPAPDPFSASASRSSANSIPRRFPKVYVEPITYYLESCPDYMGYPIIPPATPYTQSHSNGPYDNPGYFDEHRGTPTPASSLAQYYYPRG